MHVPGISRSALVAMVVVAVGRFVVGTAWAASWLTRETRTERRTLPATAALQIDARVGDIEVIGSDRRDIRLTTKRTRSVVRSRARAHRARGRAPAAERELQGRARQRRAPHRRDHHLGRRARLPGRLTH